MAAAVDEKGEKERFRECLQGHLSCLRQGKERNALTSPGADETLILGGRLGNHLVASVRIYSIAICKEGVRFRTPTGTLIESLAIVS